MREFQDKKRRHNRLYSLPVAVVLVLLVAFLGKATWNVYGKVIESEEKRAVSEKQLADLMARQAALVAEIAALETPDGKEAEVRNRYRLAREGEELIVVVDERIPEVVEEKGGLMQTLWRRATGWWK